MRIFYSQNFEYFYFLVQWPLIIFQHFPLLTNVCTRTKSLWQTLWISSRLGFDRKTILFTINSSNLVFYFLSQHSSFEKSFYGHRFTCISCSTCCWLVPFRDCCNRTAEKNRGQKHEKGKFLLNDSRTCFNRVAKWIFSYTSISICRIRRSLIRYIDFLLCFPSLFAASSLSSWLIKQDVNAESFKEGKKKTSQVSGACLLGDPQETKA